MVAVNRGERVPDGRIVDARGASTNDPNAFYAGGTLRSIAGHEVRGPAAMRLRRAHG
jgi:LDH2 family malate/lactate/ureidoglycolate dehydrogenase